MMQLYIPTSIGEVTITQKRGEYVLTATHKQKPGMSKEFLIEDVINVLFTGKMSPCTEDIARIK